MKIQILLLLVLCIGVLVFIAPPADAKTLDERVQNLESKVERLASTGLVLFLFGVFCALWAQQTCRNAWLWFFLGAFFGPITAVVLLVKNSEDRQKRKE